MNIDITIQCDSQAVLNALEVYKISSAIVLLCWDVLKFLLKETKWEFNLQKKDPLFPFSRLIWP